MTAKMSSTRTVVSGSERGVWDAGVVRCFGGGLSEDGGCCDVADRSDVADVRRGRDGARSAAGAVSDAGNGLRELP